MQLVLSLFPGADLLGMAFEQEGFCVVRGPDVLLGGDIRNFRSVVEKFDGVIGGPPCQMFSKAVTRCSGGTNALNLIPEFERVVNESKPRWWLMENVPEAPLPALDCKWNAVLDAHHYGALQHRRRRFSSNLSLIPHPMPTCEDPFPTVTATEHKVSGTGSIKDTMSARASRKVGRRLKLEEINELMGLPADWQTPALTVEMAYRVRGNGVPLQMGVALAKAIKQNQGGMRH